MGRSACECSRDLYGCIGSVFGQARRRQGEGENGRQGVWSRRYVPNCLQPASSSFWGKERERVGRQEDQEPIPEPSARERGEEEMNGSLRFHAADCRPTRGAVKGVAFTT